MPSLREAQLRHSACYLDLLAKADEEFQRGGSSAEAGLRLFEESWENIEIGQTSAREQSGECGRAAELCCQYSLMGANLLNLRFNPRQHLQWIEASLSVAREIEHPDAEAILLSNMGLVYEDLGELKRNLECQQRSLSLCRESGQRDIEETTLGNLGLAYYALSQWRDAIDCFEQQLELAQAIGDQRGHANALLDLGHCYSYLGEIPRAIEFYERAGAIFHASGNRRGEGQVIGEIGRAHV